VSRALHRFFRVRVSNVVARSGSGSAIHFRSARWILSVAVSGSGASNATQPGAL
jgi:hypothetical protein